MNFHLYLLIFLPEDIFGCVHVGRKNKNAARNLNGMFFIRTRPLEKMNQSHAASTAANDV